MEAKGRALRYTTAGRSGQPEAEEQSVGPGSQEVRTPGEGPHPHATSGAGRVSVTTVLEAGHHSASGTCIRGGRTHMATLPIAK